MLERRKVWVMENSPKFTGYCYSKRLYYVDPESWTFDFMEMFDNAGSIWKTENLNFGLWDNPKEAGGGHMLMNVSGNTLDLKINEGGPYYHHNYVINPGFDKVNADMFSLDYLRRQGR